MEALFGARSGLFGSNSNSLCPRFCSHCVIGCKISEQLSPNQTFKNLPVVFFFSLTS